MSPMGTSVPADCPPTHDPKARRAWIRYHLSLHHQTMTALANAEGVAQTSVAYAALGKGSRHLMQAIARACHIQPGTLFPEHFDETGAMRRKALRPRRAPAKPTDGAAA